MYEGLLKAYGLAWWLSDKKTTEQTYERIVRSAPKGRTDDSVVFLLFKASAK